MWLCLSRVRAAERQGRCAVKKATEASPNRALKHERELRCWSQLEVADHIGTTAFNVSRWERGITFPGSYFRQQLCLLFAKSPSELGFLKEAGPQASAKNASPDQPEQMPSSLPVLQENKEEDAVASFVLQGFLSVNQSGSQMVGRSEGLLAIRVPMTSPTLQLQQARRSLPMKTTFRATRISRATRG